MEQTDLLRLSSRGLAAFPPTALSTLGDWCYDYGRASGEARFLLLAESLRAMAAVFEDTGVDSVLVSRWDELLAEYLSLILDGDFREGSHWAGVLADEILTAALNMRETGGVAGPP